MSIRKPLKDMTREERLQYNKERYAARQKGTDKIVIELNNCPQSLIDAIIGAVRDEKEGI